MTPLTLKDYLGPYDDPRITPEVRANAERLLAVVNPVLAAAEADGVELREDPDTGCYIVGNGNGGVRPPDSPVGAKNSAHKRGHAVDIYDPNRALAGWALRNVERLKLLGIRAVEDPRWTPVWAHLSDEPLASGNFVFIPSATPPLASALPEQLPSEEGYRFV
jgi:hypothetical protein